MPKAVTTISPTNQNHNRPIGDLADEHGRLGAEIAEIEARRKAIAAEIIGRGVLHADGALFTAAVVAETTTATIDRKAIERDMGESWIAKYLKWGKRCASVRTTPRAAAVARLAA
jgi:hypothetical protein